MWYFIQNMLYFRIVEIEEELDLYSESYISYLDRESRGEEYPERPRVRAMFAAMKPQYKPLTLAQTVNNSGLVRMGIWFIVLVVQIAAMLGWI